jgi:Predicted transmembrane transcriptional regulator (anti-sigma factor)
MKFPPEILMAYADGELDAETRRAIEAEMAVDPQLAQEIERHRALRAEVGGAFARVLEEPVPDRLLRAATKKTQTRRQWSWPEWTSIAASLLIGVLAGRALLPQQDRASEMIVAELDGRVIAGGALAQALSEQLSSQDGATVDIGLSFRAKSGEYCRTFGTRGADPVAGFACREAEVWRIEMLSTSPRTDSGGDYRMASTQLPAPIVQAIAARMQGEALDADEEAIARQRRWRD